jgi:hypothetical protein
VKLLFNRTTGEQSSIEINTNLTSVRELRRAYYAVISFMDSQLGRVLDVLESTGLSNSTIVTFIGDHGYQNGQKGEWCKSNNFELATRIPMYVVVPDSIQHSAPATATTAAPTAAPAAASPTVPSSTHTGSSGVAWARGVVQDRIVESVDLFPTLADLAGIGMPPGQAVGGESMRPLLLSSPPSPSSSSSVSNGKTTFKKTWALSQWARRPSCVHTHGCPDGGGSPSLSGPDQSLMGYSFRVDRWRCVSPARV